MNQSLTPARKLTIAGIALAVVVIAAGFIWMKRPAAQVEGRSDELVAKLVSARPDQRDALILELGHRGAQVIPPVVAAYEKAHNDPDLRMQLATVIFRTNAPAQAVPALERLLEQETDPGARNTIENYLNGLRRSGRR
jgi:hypothetical protein